METLSFLLNLLTRFMFAFFRTLGCRTNVLFLSSYKYNCKKHSLFTKLSNPYEYSELIYNKVSSRTAMDLVSVVREFEDLVSPKLAESWDNTGLLLEPVDSKLISTIFLTNDLTEAVLEEALSQKADMIISYHPPIFSAFKSLRKDKWKDRLVMKCIQNSVALYSPHTACDAITEGVNDWLINCFALSSCNPIRQCANPVLEHTQQIDFSVPIDYEIEKFKSLPDTKILQISSHEGSHFLRLMCKKSTLTKFVELISSDDVVSLISMTSCESLPHPLTGMGRIGNLKTSLTVQQAINILKNYLQLDHLRVALGTSHKLDSLVTSVAVCAGSGSSILSGVNADLYVTGEMSHHDLLDANHKGKTVILCEHSNSERGYLHVLANQLKPKMIGVNFVVSIEDKDPVLIV